MRPEVCIADSDQAELRAVALTPFEVVEGRPVQVAAHVGPFGPRLGDRDEVGVQVVDAFGVVGGGDAVLGDVQRQAGAGGVVQHLAQAVGVDGPAHLGRRRTGWWGAEPGG